MQAGASPRGRDFAARWAEAIFCTASTKEDAIAFYTDVKGRMTRFGRSPDDCAIYTSTTVVLGQRRPITFCRCCRLKWCWRPTRRCWAPISARLPTRTS
jgi:hypothetical protein